MTRILTTIESDLDELDVDKKFRIWYQGHGPHHYWAFEEVANQSSVHLRLHRLTMLLPDADILKSLAMV
jgi:hypothetical protein